MDFNLYFCKDGILRAGFGEKKPFLPVKFLQEQSKYSDLSFWVRWWENKVSFEEGLTVGGFLQCLEPWQDFFGELTCKNIKEYIRESKKPILVKNKKEGDEKPLDWVGISYFTEIELNREYERTQEDDKLLEEDFNAWINAKKRVRLTGDWNVHSSYKITGFVSGVEDQYSIEYTPLNELANLPIILSPKHVIYINEWALHHYFPGEGLKFLAENAYGVLELKGENKIRFLLAEKTHNIRDVIEGFFWWMYSNPVSRDDFVESLEDSLKEIKDSRDSKKENNVEKTTNVISLFGEKEPLVKEEVDSVKEVIVADGAFDSIVNSYQKDSDYWEEMVSLANQDNSIIVKIGKFEPAKVFEERIFGYTISEETLLKKSIPTEYK